MEILVFEMMLMRIKKNRALLVEVKLTLCKNPWESGRFSAENFPRYRVRHEATLQI